jgi:prepilin-type N-terminal cleavage/methylation domain-containing protein
MFESVDKAVARWSCSITKDYKLKNKAFTLIELLVVIAIIAILAAILFPVFAQAKAAAKKTAALSNLKQNAVAVLMYNTDFDDTYAQSAYSINFPNGVVVPGSGAEIFSVYDAIFPYTKNKDIYNDPADPKAIGWKKVLNSIGLKPYTGSGAAIEFAGAAVNFALFEDPAVPPTLFGADPVVSEGSISTPAGTAMFFSARYIGAGVQNLDVPVANQADVPNYFTPAGPFAAQNFPGTARHNGTLIINFSDGHAKSYNKNAQLPGTAIDKNFANGADPVQVYHLPYDVNGIPDFVSEGKP